MLERVDLEQVFAAASRRSLHHCEIYAETLFTAQVTIRDKRTETRLSTNGGVLMEAENVHSGAREAFVTSEGSTRSLLEVLGDPGAKDLPFSPSPLPAEWPFEKLEDRLQRLSQLFRHIWPEDRRLSHPILSFSTEIKHFEIGRPQTPIARGREESAFVKIEWQVKSGNERKTFHSELFRSSAELLLQELCANNVFIAEVERSLSTTAPWPAPKGDIPVHWSARAVSKLAQKFLQTFEGDRVLGEQSLLTHWPDQVSLGFSLEESPPVAIDHEGSQTRPRVLFDGARPKGLLVDRKLGEHMSVPSTGHCRRASLTKKSTVCFWRAKLVGKQSLEDLKPKLQWGLSIRDLDILTFDVVSATVRLRLSDTVLLHHGEEGETIEPLVFQLSLLDLFQSWTWFSTTERITGLELEKDEQHLLTEISAPSALSESLNIPGQVPAGHYW